MNTHENDLVTIEDVARESKTTWRTARKRLNEAGIRPELTTKKSELYPRIPAMRAALYPDARDQEQIDRVLGFIGASLTPAIWGTHSLFFQCLLGALRERGASKAEALQQAGELLYLFLDGITRYCLPGDMKSEPPDWLAEAAERFPDLAGIELMTAYANRYWPDNV